VLGFLNLVSARELALSILALGEVDVKVVNLLDKLIFFGFGVVGLAVIILAEGYFRNGVQSGRLFERVGLVFGIGLLCLFVFDGLRLVIPGIVDAARPGVIQTFVSLSLGLWCFGMGYRRRKLRM
jgi:hypothetical protein